MELKEIIEHLKSPDKILDLGLQERIIDWLTFFIYELELEIADYDFIVDTKMAKLVEVHGSVAAAEVQLKLTDDYRQRKQKDITLKALKGYRNNIRKKRDRVIGH
jgi:hypothetical protein